MTDADVTLPHPPSEHYNLHHIMVNTAPVPRSVVVWNTIDFSHVNWVHKRNYKYCKVLAESSRTHLLEYGVRVFFFLRLPFSTPVLMWHEFVPPGLIRHLSRSAWGSYTKVEIRMEEIQKEGHVETRVTHNYSTHLPAFLLPFKKLFIWYLDAWSERLWNEDSAIFMRRYRVLQTGFKDHPVDVTPRATEGLFA